MPDPEAMVKALVFMGFYVIQGRQTRFCGRINMCLIWLVQEVVNKCLLNA